MKIYLVRHGQTDWNYQKKIQGQQDVDINEQGIRQAEKLAEILKNVPFEYAVCSPLTRAHHTAEILLKYHSVPLSYDERLKEIYLGEWEGKTHKEVMTQEKNPVFSLSGKLSSGWRYGIPGEIVPKRGSVCKRSAVSVGGSLRNNSGSGSRWIDSDHFESDCGIFCS